MVHEQQEQNDEIIEPSEYKDQVRREIEDRWYPRIMHGQFFRDTDGIGDRKKSWLWLKMEI